MNRLQKIATESRLTGGKKTNKTTAWDALLSVISSEQFDESKEGDIGILYQFFMPPAPTKNPKSAADWLQLATGKKDIRDYLNEIYSDGENVYGADGHRVHVAYGLAWPKGYYNRAGLLIDDLGTYPDILRVVKGLDNLQKLEHVDLATAPRKPGTENTPKTLVQLQGFEGWFGEQFVTDALAGMTDPDIRVRVDSVPKGMVQGTLWIECWKTKRVAVVMGVREEESGQRKK